MNLFPALLVLAMSTTVAHAADPAATAATPARERLTLGGGCFWCVEAVYEELKGVDSAVSGYAGGHTPNPSYKQVTTGTTGHAEVVQITFDPAVVTRDQILEVFFATHDPTTLNRQGADVGPMYRSAAYYENDTQKQAIEAAVAEAASNWPGKSITTEVAPLKAFYPAEDYHQQYFELNGSQPYCNIVIAPKIAKFRKQYASWLK